MIIRPLLLLAVTAASLQAQSVGDELRARTGNALPEFSKSAIAFSTPPGITLTERLTAGDAVSIALWNNTALQADLANLEVTRSDVVTAGMFRNPNFSTLFPVGPKPFEFLLAWPIEELWQRKNRVKAAKANFDVVATGLVQNGLNLIRDVRIAHANLWLAQERAQTLQQSADLRERIAVLTERRRSAGEGTGLEVSIARVDAQSTLELADSAAGSIEALRSRLRRLLGAPLSTPITAVGDENPTTLPPLAALVETALSSRPDLRAAELEIDAAAQRAKWERSRVLALIAPILSIKEVGEFGVRTGPGFSADLPVLSRNQGPISRADAEVIRAGRLYEAAIDRVEQEVSEAYQNALQARTTLLQLRDRVLRPVEETNRIAERAYQNGDISLLTVLEVNRQRFDITLREIEARAALIRALAELERAMGRNL